MISTITKLIRYDELELSVTAEYVDESFAHAFGTQYQGFYEISEIKYNNTIIPLALVSEDTLDYLEAEFNK